MLVYRNVPHSWVKVVSDVQVIHLSHKIFPKKKIRTFWSICRSIFLGPAWRSARFFWGKCATQVSEIRIRCRLRRGKKNTTSQQPRIARSQTSRWLIDDLNCSLIHANLPSDMKKHETPCVNIPNEFNVFSICFTSRERSFCHPGWQSKNWPQHHCIPAPSWRIDI